MGTARQISNFFRTFCQFGAVGVALLAFVAGTPAHAGNRVALVIGNSTYRNVPRLENPVNDATDIGNAFGRLGFSVRTLIDATYGEMREGLLEFGRRVHTADIAVVYFAGHGIEVGGENWLIPVDAELRSDLDADYEAVSLHSLLPAVENAGKLGLVILDACRDNPFTVKMRRTTRTRALSRGLAAVEPNTNVLVAYAAKEGTTAADGHGRNSPFTSSLLRYIETPGLEINFLFRNVRDDVIKMTKRQQQPFVYGSLSREAIYLKEHPVAAVAKQPAPGASPDELAWSFLRDTSDQTALQRFVDRYPASSYREQAESRISLVRELQAARAKALEESITAKAIAAERQAKNVALETKVASLSAETGRPSIRAPRGKQHDTSPKRQSPGNAKLSRRSEGNDLRVYDGSWHFAYTSNSCGPLYRSKVSISNGVIRSRDGGGRISPDGRVTASGSFAQLLKSTIVGRMTSGSSGGGSWRGGSLLCRGQWRLSR